MQFTGAAILGLASVILTLLPQAAKAEWSGIVEAKQIAEEGYIYGLPIMYDYAVDPNSGQFKAPFNQIKNEARVFTYKDTAIISPNSDTPCSVLSLDLRAEPVILSVPSVEKGRYYSVQLIDGNTFNYGYIGSRATGNYMVVGPDWKGKAPSGGKKVFRSGTQFSLAVYRTQLFAPDDMPNVEKVQVGYKVLTLSSYLGEQAPASAPMIDFPKVDKDLIKTNFFEYLDFALQFAPATSADEEIRAKLAKIGVGPGKSFQFKDLPLGHRLEIALGVRDGEAKVKEYLASKLFKVNRWSVSDLWGDAAFFDGDWLKRAAGASAVVPAH